MKKKPGVIRTGTARDLAEHASGYSGNGESLHTRVISRQKPTPRMKSRDNISRHGATLADLIALTKSRLRFFECELQIEDNPVRRERISTSIKLKTEFLARLHAGDSGYG